MSWISIEKEERRMKAEPKPKMTLRRRTMRTKKLTTRTTI
jgi:hypothetical protein